MPQNFRVVTKKNRHQCYRHGGCEVEIYGIGFLMHAWYGENQVLFNGKRGLIVDYKTTTRKITVVAPPWPVNVLQNGAIAVFLPKFVKEIEVLH